jgi:arylsulfatase A-like enzyme
MTHGDPKRGGRHGDIGLKIGREGLKPITDFVEHAQKEKKPFLLWYAPFLPHTPHNPPERLLKKYRKEGRPMDQAKYFAMCEWFDETCGELLGYLDNQGLTENTLVVFTCDNGWSTASSNKMTQTKNFGVLMPSEPRDLLMRGESETPFFFPGPEKYT